MIYLYIIAKKKHTLLLQRKIEFIFYIDLLFT